ncbi:uncharacterized protein METZ01_LOCUS254083, partial [marine metagenome]
CAERVNSSEDVTPPQIDNPPTNPPTTMTNMAIPTVRTKRTLVIGQTP